MATATEQKRQDLLTFIQRVMEPDPAVQAVIGIGSIATGLAKPTSDIDAMVFLDPFDWYVVPAEFVWRPSVGTFHSIFEEADWVEADSIQFDFARCDLQEWSSPDYHWPEGRKSELAAGWMAFDRTGQVTDLIAERTAYDPAVRTAKLDEAIVWMDQHLGWETPQEKWDTMGPLIAHDRLQATYFYLVQAMFAYNRQWRPWRNREMSYLPNLPWLPENFDQQIAIAANPPSLDFAGYQTRFHTLKALFEALLARLVADGEYEEDAISQAFIRSSEEPGRAWNMAAWNEKHRARLSQFKS